MDEQIFEATADPKEIAGRLGLEIVQWFEGILYVRDNDYLYSIEPVNAQIKGAVPADLRMCVRKVPTYNSEYIGEEYHSPREAAVHGGLTVIEEYNSSGDVVALDGFGRKIHVTKTGNGPMAVGYGWASAEEIRKWVPQHHPRKRTIT